MKTMTLPKKLIRGPLVFEGNAFKRALFPGGYVQGGKAHFYVCDLQGNVRQVLDGSTGTVQQETHYYPYGTPFGESTAERLSSLNGASVQPYLYGGKERLAVEGFNAHDYCARLQFSDLGIFSSPDPLSGTNPSFSQYAFCVGDPVNFIDPIGCDTLKINLVDNKWTISDPIIAKGDDVFIVNDGNQTSTYTFSEGEYGKSVCALNLENAGEGSYNLGVYHVSGQSTVATGFYVTPGGEASNVNNSGKRIKDGTYPIVAPHENALWRTPGVGGEVKDRGIRFHYSDVENPLGWTEGCFVLFPDYGIENNSININPHDSKKASINFNKALGASREIEYKNKKGKDRTGAIFPNGINYQLLLKTR